MCCVALMGRRGHAVGSRQEGHRSDSQAVFSPTTPAAFPETNDVHIGQTGCFTWFIGASVRSCLFACGPAINWHLCPEAAEIRFHDPSDLECRGSSDVTYMAVLPLLSSGC